ncbi:MAG: type IV pilus twitching motility protein PilT [Armatimonadota bacterium]
MDLRELAKLAADRRASDLFIKVGSPPALRIDGKITMTELPKLTDAETRELAYGVMSHEQIGRFERRHEMDLAFTIDGVARFRANVYQQRGTIGMVLRVIPLDIYTLEQLGMPQVIGDLCMHKQGLILLTGPTGSGKSTTLAAMIDLINRSRRCNIVTIEDPLEFIHEDKLSIINQREISIDTDSFSEALKYVVRQSPDVILIGEMRDVETMNVALAAAETGHLVFSTVHTTSAAGTMERIINMFPPHDKPQICLRMSDSLRGIISQKLLPRADGPGRIGGIEIMIGTPTISKLIEEGRSGQLYPSIAEGGFWGMQTMNQCLLKYYKAGLITEDIALLNAGNQTELKQMIRRP